MYYSSGNYEAFAKPEKPSNMNLKSAYIVGSGLAALATACFLIRDGQMSGDKIHILEELSVPGGACDGIEDVSKGFITRGSREMEEHFECLWDLLRTIPSIETEGISVLDEFYWLNKKDPNFSIVRATEKNGENAHTDGKYALSEKSIIEVLKLYLTKDEELYNKKISEVFSKEFFSSNMWLYWSTMFAFKEVHGALELKRFFHRFIHHIGTLPDFSAIKLTKYNQYESLILPIVKFLESNNVDFQYNTEVTNIIFEISTGRKEAKKIIYSRDEESYYIDLTQDDLVFVTNGSTIENSTFGDDNHAPDFIITDGGSWELWRNIAKQDPLFGNPDNFCNDTDSTNWESATITTLDDKIPSYIQKICKRDLFTGRTGTGGIISVKDSNWLISYTVNRQPQFKNQDKTQLIVWLYGSFTNVIGNFIKKPMRDCTGKEIIQEWLYHLGVPRNEIEDLAKNSARCIPCVMPFVSAPLMPRGKGDRPMVVPYDCINFAFIGQFAETERDATFTSEYSVRTAMEAVYTLLEIDRGVPAVYGSCYDVRVLLEAISKLLDGKKLVDIKLPLILNLVEKKLLNKIDGTVIDELFRKYNVI